MVGDTTTACSVAGAGTVMLAEPDWPSLVAVTLAVPAAPAVTNPLALTLAMAEFELLQAIARPVSTLPLASLSVAVSCAVFPDATVLAAGVTLTVATATGAGALIETLAESANVPSLSVAMTQRSAI